jgi:hypothetical protein
VGIVAVLWVGMSSSAWGETFIRVITQRAHVRTGPGASFRSMFVAERGTVLGVRERGTKGYWFRVELEDGTSGWIFGEQVIPFEVVDEEEPGFFVRMGRAVRRAILGPTPLPDANVELSFSAGALGGEGLFLFRPAWLIDSYFALEGFAGESPRKQETLLIAGLGWTLRLAPGAAIGPYLHAGAGVGHFDPKEDAFTLEPRTLMTVSAGGGFEITLKKRITLRLDFRNWTFFDENEAALLFSFSLVGCGRYAVRPNEKEHLADRTMQFDPDAQETNADDHVLANREGSSGGRGTGGGGCGCN